MEKGSDQNKNSNEEDDSKQIEIIVNDPITKREKAHSDTKFDPMIDVSNAITIIPQIIVTPATNLPGAVTGTASP
ncbi:1887_t:CDS:2 [Entrophospora sp. SA101]|nr:1887_t:CDS:2 [Entrophospora sp. SA101]